MPCWSGKGWIGQHQTGAAALDQPGTEEAREAEKTQKTRPKAGDERQ